VIRNPDRDGLFVLGLWELRMSSPSIIPNDRLDRDIYLVLEDFCAGASWRETDEADTDVLAIVEDLLTGQYEQPLRVVVFNPVERWSRDASEEIAEELDRRISAEGREVSEALQEFVESNLGRKIGVQLALPLTRISESRA
jgi:hypothetical protein